MHTNERHESGKETRPDLSRLTDDVQLRIAVVEQMGAVWGGDARGLWYLLAPAGDHLAVYAEGEVSFLPRCPDPLNDPVVWGVLMEREMDGWKTGTRGGVVFHVCRWETRNGWAYKEGPRAATLGRAACLAFLAKNGVASQA